MEKTLQRPLPASPKARAAGIREDHARVMRAAVARIRAVDPERPILLDGLGRLAEAQAARAESLGWARYGFGSDVEVMARMADIAALAAAGRRS